MATVARSRNGAVGLALASLVLFLFTSCDTYLTGPDAGPAGTCSTDQSQSRVVGKFTQYTVGANKTNVLIFLSNCKWCADAIADGASQALTSEGVWSSSIEPADAGSLIKVTKTNSMYFNILSYDGSRARSYATAGGTYAGFEYTKEASSAFTCDGQ
jgi:hypothetical protein